MNFAGLDIGGANIKFASTSGEKREVSFPIWKQKEKLAETLEQFCQFVPANDFLGITMTAELADCFESKSSGVSFIVDCVSRVFGDKGNGNKPLFYRTDATMCDANTAIKDWRLVAASNWHALAWLAFHDSNENSGFVFDIGSTTTDIIPVQDGLPVNPRQNDFDRLANGQLFYGGIGRTPICGLLDNVELDSHTFNVAREFFATTSDALIFLDDLPEDKNCFDTADGKSNSQADVQRRLLRMVCADAAELEDKSSKFAHEIAIAVRKSLTDKITVSLSQVLNANKELPLNFVAFGSGSWLAKSIVERKTLTLTNKPTFRQFSEDSLTNQTAAALAVAKKRQHIFKEYGQ